MESASTRSLSRIAFRHDKVTLQMTRNTTIVWICGLLLVAVGGTGGCGWSNSRARGLHLWKQDHVTYRFRNFPFVPSNAVGQCPAPGDCPTEFIEPPFFGYHDTCWRRWPQGWEPCPVEPVAEVEEVEPESLQPESPSPSPSDRSEDSSSATPTPAKEPDSVIVPATPKEAPTTKPASPKGAEAPVVQPPTPRVEKPSSKAAPEGEPAKPPSRDDATIVPQAPSLFPSAFRALTAPTEVALAPRGKRAARPVPSLTASDTVSVPRHAEIGEPAVAPPAVISSSIRDSQRLRRSLRDRMRLSSITGEPIVKRASAVRTESSTRHAAAARVSAEVKARPIPRFRKTTSNPSQHRSDNDQGNEPKLIPQSIPARPIATVGSSQRTPRGNASSFAKGSDTPEPMIIDARKLRAAQK